MIIHLRQSYSFILQGKRENQEDSRFPDKDMPDASQRFFIVCDGVGGHSKGEVASRLVANSMGSLLSKFDWKENFSNADFRHVLDVAYNELDANAVSANRDMATTLVLAAFHDGGMTLSHIGDSRVYHIRPNEGIIYRSDDHSMVNTMVHNGMITPDEATIDNRRHIITRYMSPTDADQTRCMATVLRTADVQDGDYVFLCSDGVLQCIDDDALLDILSRNNDDRIVMEEIKRRCIDSSDNSTATLIHIDKVEQGLPLYHQLTLDDNNTAYYNHNEDGVVNIASTMRTRKKSNGLISFLKGLFN